MSSVRVPLYFDMETIEGQYIVNYLSTIPQRAKSKRIARIIYHALALDKNVAENSYVEEEGKSITNSFSQETNLGSVRVPLYFDLETVEGQFIVDYLSTVPPRAKSKRIASIVYQFLVPNKEDEKSNHVVEEGSAITKSFSGEYAKPADKGVVNIPDTEVVEELEIDGGILSGAEAWG